MKLRRKIRQKLQGIGAKTTFSHVLLAFLVILFASISTYVLLYGFLRDNLQSELLSRARAVAAQEERTDVRHEESRMRMYEELTDATVLYFDTEFIATHLNGGDAQVQIREEYSLKTRDGKFKQLPILDTLDKYFFSRILAGETVSDIRSFEFVQDEIIFAGAPVHGEDGEVLGGVVLIQSIDTFQQQSDMFLHLLLLFALIAMPLAVVISIRFSRRLTKPLLNITQGARRMSEGHYGEHIVPLGGDEMADLAETLNTLSNRLRANVGDLLKERDKLDLMMDSMGEGILAVDWYMRVVHCNQPFLQLMELEKAPEEASTEAEYGRIMQLCMKKASRQRAVWTDGSGNRLLAVASPLHNAAQAVIGAVCLVQDVSEAERLEQMRKDYIANISHELRTPLTGIRGMVEPLIDGVLETEEEKQDCYQVIYKETVRLEKLIQEMLDLSRLQSGRVQIELEKLEINGILQAAARRVQRRADEDGIRLTTQAGENLFCRGNEDRILQALTIFLDNAMRFTPFGGSVSVYARREGEFVRAGVRDTGCGVEPKDLPYIWERFYKADRSRMRTPGSGLGLAIAKLVVELMGGEIGVETQKGKGSDFYFRLKAE